MDPRRMSSLLTWICQNSERNKAGVNICDKFILTTSIKGCCTGGCVRGAIVVATVTITLIVLGGAVLFLDLRDQQQVFPTLLIDLFLFFWTTIITEQTGF